MVSRPRSTHLRSHFAHCNINAALQTAVTLLNQFLTPQLGASFRPHIWVRKYRFLIFRRVPDLIILVPGYGGQNLVQKMIPKRIVLYNCFEHAVRSSAALQPKFDPEAGPCFWAVVFWLTQKAQSSSALSSSLSSALSHQMNIKKAVVLMFVCRCSKQCGCPETCSDQCSHQCRDAQISADAQINVCGCVCVCVGVGVCCVCGWVRVCVCGCVCVGVCVLCVLCASEYG